MKGRAKHSQKHQLEMRESLAMTLARYQGRNVDFVPVWGWSHAAFSPTARTRVSRSSMTG